jgi:hypothetical protein
MRRAVRVKPVETPAMQLPRLQFTIRGMMVAVTFMAVALGVGIGGVGLWVSFSYRQQASKYARLADYWRWQAGRVPELYPGWNEAEVRESLDKTIRWNLLMEDKCRRAAFRPWEAIPPDPPRP